ncbi:hypothetical protein C8R46DRAFT_1349382 [Mycena filopes]|nr:hypothetical protein C8R46DRAFT_1349382 [Mycena filopes]
MASTVERLSDDLLLLVLELSDIRTILVASQVNQYFRTLALSSHLWRGILRRLNPRSIIELPPPDVFLESSVQDLIELVRSAVVGPRSWAKSSRWKPPNATRKVHSPIQLHQAGPGNAFTRVLDVLLLPDARHVAISHASNQSRSLEVWDLETASRKYFLNSFGFGLPVIHRAHALRVVVLHTSTLRLWEIEVLNIDIPTGASTSLYFVRLCLSTSPNGSPLICDHFILVRGLEFGGSVTLIDWQTESYVRLPHGMFEPPPVLVPGFLILSEYECYGAELLVYSIPSLTAHWRPLSDLAPGSPTARAAPQVPIPPTVRQRVALGSRRGTHISVTTAVHASPLDADDAFIVSVYLSPVRPNGVWSLRPPRAVFERFRLAPALWSRLESHAAPPLLDIRALSYSGYSVDKGGDVFRMRGRANAGPVLRGSGVQQQHVSLAPYGGTVLEFAGNELRIAYCT